MNVDQQTWSIYLRDLCLFVFGLACLSIGILRILSYKAHSWCCTMQQVFFSKLFLGWCNSAVFIAFQNAA